MIGSKPPCLSVAPLYLWIIRIESWHDNGTLRYCRVCFCLAATITWHLSYVSTSVTDLTVISTYNTPQLSLQPSAHRETFWWVAPIYISSLPSRHKLAFYQSFKKFRILFRNFYHNVSTMLGKKRDCFETSTAPKIRDNFGFQNLTHYLYL